MLHLDGTQLQVVLEVVKKKAGLFLNVDRSFLVEVACMEAMLTQQGDGIMEQGIQACFPSEAQPFTLDDTYHKLAALQGGLITQVTGSSASQTLNATMEIIMGMRRGEAPERQFFTSAFMQKLQPKLDFFCQYRYTKEGKTILLTGKGACIAKFQRLAEKHEQGAITFKDLEEIHCFEWLLEDQANKNMLKSMTSNLLLAAKATAMDGSKRLSKGSAVPVASKGSSSAAQPADATMSDVMALFG